MQPTFIIIHTAGYDGDADIVEIDRWHGLRNPPFNRRGTHTLQHIGYQYYIRRDGTLQKGRAETETGAHCKDKGMNRKSIGICCEGNGDKENFTAAQRATLKSLYREIYGRWQIPVQNVLGHRETGAPKTCPGTQVDMNELRIFLS